MKQLFPPEIIEYSAENYFSRGGKTTSIIYLTVLLALVAGIIITPFIEIDVTTQSRGIVKSSIENNCLQAAVYGEIDAVYLYENKFVSVGDTLIVISTNKLKEQIETYKRNLSENVTFIQDINAILNYHSEKIKTPKYLSEYNEYITQLTEQQLQTEMLLHEKRVSDQLFEKKVETEMDHLKAVNNYNISVKREKLIHDQFHKKWQAEFSRLENENKDLSSSLSQLSVDQQQYVIKAPISGTIIQYAGLMRGNFIVPNQIIAKISAISDLLVECYVSPDDIGYLQIGTKVRFQFDAYNYNQWGLANGEIVEISSDILYENDQSVLRYAVL